MKKKNISLLIATIVYGLCFGIIGEIIYSKIIESWYKPFVIGLYFFLFSLILMVVIYKFSKNKQKNFSNHLVRDVVISLIGIFCISMLLEIIYEVGEKNVYNEPTSYIFLIDDSGSMMDNDPNEERVQAVSTVVNDKESDFNYAVYTFDDKYNLARTMSPKKNGLETIELHSNGGTAISTTIKGVTHDIETGAINGGEYPKILLLSDGHSTDNFYGIFGIRKEIQKLQKLGVTISTIGLGESVDKSFLSSLAQKTGGVYINIDNINQLSNAMKEAISTYANRDLLGIRPYNKLNLLYAFLRILFIFIIASGILVVKCLVCGGSNFSGIFLGCTILNLIAAILLEFGLNLVAIGNLVSHIVMCILIASIINSYTVTQQVSIDTNYFSEAKDFNGEYLKNKNKKSTYQETLS